MALKNSITRLLFGLVLVIIGLFVSVTEARVFGLKTCGSGSPGFCGSGTISDSLAPSMLFFFSEDGSSLNKVGFVQIGGIDIDADGLAISKNNALLAFEIIRDTSNESIVMGSRLVSIDKTNAVATPIGPQLADREIRGAAFGRNDRIWAIDTSGNELLEVNPTSGLVIGSPVPLTLNGNAFDVGSFTDLAIDNNDIAVLSNIFDFFKIDLSTGNLSSFFQGVTSDAYAGLAYSAGANAGDIFTYDVQNTDDIYMYDQTQNRNNLYPDIIAEFNAGRGDLASTPVFDVAYAGPDQIICNEICDEVILDGRKSQGAIESFKWDLNHEDDQCDQSVSGETAKVTDLCPGIYNVTLTVTDDDGLTDTDEMVLTVLETCNPCLIMKGDLDSDGDVDGDDLRIFSQFYGTVLLTP